MAERLNDRRFVILEHHWNGVHWDLMLEAGDSLRAWAIDAPIVPGADLPARALANHRSIYLEYEGPISDGRGHVKRVATGTYRVLEWGDDRVRVVLSGGQLVGELKLYRAVSTSDEEFSASNPAEVGEPWSCRFGNVD